LLLAVLEWVSIDSFEDVNHLRRKINKRKRAERLFANVDNTNVGNGSIGIDNNSVKNGVVAASRLQSELSPYLQY